VISTASNTVTATIPIDADSLGVAVSPDSSTIYATTGRSTPEGGSTGVVAVIAAESNTVTATIPVGSSGLQGVAVTPDGKRVYVTDGGTATVFVISTASNTVTATIPVGHGPLGVAVTPDGSLVYVANFSDNTVSVISTASNTVTATIPVGTNPYGLAVTPDGSAVYVANPNTRPSSTVSVIATKSNTVIATIPVSLGAAGVSVTPDSNKVYIANASSGLVTVISPASNTVTRVIRVGIFPFSVGIFIQPGPRLLKEDEILATTSGLASSRSSRTFNGTIKITNISNSPIAGPFQIVLSSLTPGVTLTNATGSFGGSPRLTVNDVSELSAGHSAVAKMQFSNPSFGAISFVPTTYAGALH
jgi:YVTN family beta-propeller protein